MNLFIQPDHAKAWKNWPPRKTCPNPPSSQQHWRRGCRRTRATSARAATAKRLDRLSRQFERLERDQNILIETMALYVRYYLTVSTPVPEAHQEAAKAQGKARFEQFIEQLGRHVLRGRSLVKEVYEEIQPDAKRVAEAAMQEDSA